MRNRHIPMINAATEPSLVLMSLEEFIDYSQRNPDLLFFLGMDVARKQHLCVIDVGEKFGDTIYDRIRIELLDKSYSEMEQILYRLLELPGLERACVDANGLGSQLAERAQSLYPWKVQPVAFTPVDKQRLAYGLHEDFKEVRLRIPHDDKLRADLRGVKKEVSASERVRFIGETQDSHCDRFWAKALRQEATRHHCEVGAEVGW